jgi:FtsP/CotA-like multicopper oxidase with cupredoxin domain
VFATGSRVLLGAAAIVMVLAGIVGCSDAAAPPTGPIVAGASVAPREVNIIARDDTFAPDAVDFVPGETVLLHVINGGLEVHEAVIGDAAVQDAWEAVEAATAGRPPGPTAVVSVPPGVAGIRVVVKSGERVDLTWTVPLDAAASGRPWVVGCHIPGHWARGMQVPVRWVGPGAWPATPGPASPSTVPAS